MPAPLCILLTGDVPAAIINETGNFDAMFLRMADYAGLETRVLAVARGERPDTPDRYCGVIVTGSPAMVTDREPWSEECGAWLCRAVATGARVFGVCYGHQLLAQSLGGAADYHPLGMEVGTRTVTLCPEAAAHPLTPALPGRFPVNLVRSQTVTSPPPGATVLAFSEDDPYQMLSYGPHALSMQFHPEFDRAVTRRYVDLIAGTENREERIRRKRIRLGEPVRETPEAASLLQRFVDACRER